MKCEQCGYERHPNDYAPAGECPRCGAAYGNRRSSSVLSEEESDQAQARARFAQGAAHLAAAARPMQQPALVACSDCDGQVSRMAVVCPHCGRPFGNGRQPIEVMNVKMEFEAMVWFIVKWALASIPAMIILFLIFLAIVKLIGWRIY